MENGRDQPPQNHHDRHNSQLPEQLTNTPRYRANGDAQNGDPEQQGDSDG